MVHALSSEKLRVSVSTKGAELVSIKNDSGEEYLWQGDPNVWPRQAPILFPIVGKLKDNRYFFKDTEYRLGQHGFARDKEFRLIKQGENELVFELTEDEESLKNYPFQFRLQIKYSIKANVLITSYNVFNSSSTDSYFSIGAHPGFQLKRNEDYFLKFEETNLVLTTLNSGLICNTTNKFKIQETGLAINRELFLKDALVFENNQIQQVSLFSIQRGLVVKMNCAGWPFFGIWSKTTESAKPQFVCLEPWYGVADHELHTGQLKNKLGTVHLHSGGTFNAAFSLSFA